MRTTQIRQQPHDYIDSAEDKKLKAIYTLLEDDLSDDYQLSAASMLRLWQFFTPAEAQRRNLGDINILDINVSID